MLGTRRRERTRIHVIKRRASRNSIELTIYVPDHCDWLFGHLHARASSSTFADGGQLMTTGAPCLAPLESRRPFLSPLPAFPASCSGLSIYRPTAHSFSFYNRPIEGKVTRPRALHRSDGGEGGANRSGSFLRFSCLPFRKRVARCSSWAVHSRFFCGHCVLQLGWLLSPTAFLKTYYFIISISSLD